MDGHLQRALPLRRSGRRLTRGVALLWLWIGAVSVGIALAYGIAQDRLKDLSRVHQSTFGEWLREDDPRFPRVALVAPPLEVRWPALRPRGLGCVADVWVAAGEVRSVKVSGCHTSVADAVHAAVSEAEWPSTVAEPASRTASSSLSAAGERRLWVPDAEPALGAYRTRVVLEAPPTPLSVLGEAAAWWVTWLLLVAAPVLVRLAARGRSATAPTVAPLEVARDRSRPMRQRAAAVAALADHGEGPDLLLEAAREFKAVPELAAVVVEGVRRRPTPERLRELTLGAERRWADWSEEVRDDADWVLVQGLARSPDLPGAEVGLVAALRSRDPEVRRQAAERLGEVGTPAAIPALRRGEALVGRSARRAIERIAARAGVGPGDLALGVEGGALALAADDGGALSEAPADPGPRDA